MSQNVIENVTVVAAPVQPSTQPLIVAPGVKETDFKFDVLYGMNRRSVRWFKYKDGTVTLQEFAGNCWKNVPIVVQE